MFQTGWRYCAAWANTFTSERYFPDLRVIFRDPNSEMWLFLSSFKIPTLSTNYFFSKQVDFWWRKVWDSMLRGRAVSQIFLIQVGFFCGSMAAVDLILSSVRTTMISEGFSGQCSLFSRTKRNSRATIYLNLTYFNIPTSTSGVWDDTTLCKKIFLI